MDFAVNGKYADSRCARIIIIVVGAQFRSSPRGDRKYNARQISLLVISLQAAFSPLQKKGERAARIIVGDSSNQYSILPFEKKEKIRRTLVISI